jgi:hypothetical protein
MGKEEKEEEEEEEEEEAVKHTTSKRGISRGKRPALRTRSNQFEKRCVTTRTKRQLSSRYR